MVIARSEPSQKGTAVDLACTSADDSGAHRTKTTAALQVALTGQDAATFPPHRERQLITGTSQACFPSAVRTAPRVARAVRSERFGCVRDTRDLGLLGNPLPGRNSQSRPA